MPRSAASCRKFWQPIGNALRPTRRASPAADDASKDSPELLEPDVGKQRVVARLAKSWF